MPKLQLLTMGSDPELFLEDAAGKVISAIGKVGGTKEKPKQVKSLPKGFTVQEDNVLLEYNTPVARSNGVWFRNQEVMREYLHEMVGKLGLKLSDKASHSMSDDQLQHPKAFVFGCEPDYNVWLMKWNNKPQCDDPTLRSAGGHIHVGYSNPNMADSIRIGRALDYWVGAPLAEVDPDKRRRLLYGKPGAIRFKPYGLEYRTPSNFWTLAPERVEAVYFNVLEAVAQASHYDSMKRLFESAARFLAGDSAEWDKEYFQARGAAYDAKQAKNVKAKPVKFFSDEATIKWTTNTPIEQQIEELLSDGEEEESQ